MWDYVLSMSSGFGGRTSCSLRDVCYTYSCIHLIQHALMWVEGIYYTLLLYHLLGSLSQHSCWLTCLRWLSTIVADYFKDIYVTWPSGTLDRIGWWLTTGTLVPKIDGEESFLKWFLLKNGLAAIFDLVVTVDWGWVGALCGSLLATDCRHFIRVSCGL